MSRSEMHTLQFDSLVDAGRFARVTKRIPDSTKSSVGKDYDHSWDLGMTLREATQYAEKGIVWTDGLEQMTSSMKITDQLAAKAMLPAPERVVVGNRPCVAAHVQGHPKAMWRKTPQPRSDRPVLTIGCPMGIYWGTTAKQRLNFGAALLSAVDQLERNGYRCEIIALWRAGPSNHDHYSKWVNIEYKLKRPEQQWNPAKMSWLLAHPAAQRRLTWKIAETQEQWRSAIRGGYCDNSNTREFHASMAADFDIYFDNVDNKIGSACNSPEGAFKYVEKILNQQLHAAKEAVS